jgi:hypothetical protein
VNNVINGGELFGARSSWKLAFEFVLNGLHLLLLLKLLFTQRFVGCELIVLQFNGEESTAFPAAVRTLIA